MRMRMARSQPTRGIRNSNPGNIRHNPTNQWQGIASQQLDIEFVTFKDMTYGIRAMARLLINYFDKENRDTVPQIIKKWAPAHENDTQMYIRTVEAQMTRILGEKITDSTKLNLHDYDYLRALMESMWRVECGPDWQDHISDAQIVKGLTLAGVEPAKKKPLAQTRTIKGQQVAAAATVGGAVVDHLSKIADAKDQLEPLVAYSDWIKYAFLALALLGIGITVWARFDDRRKGVN